MGRDAALISMWRDPVAGREAKSLEVFMDFLTFWGKHAADGKCTEPEAFFNYDGSEGIAIVKGKSDILMQIWESEESEKLLAKAHLIVQDLKVHLYATGDEEVQRSTRLFAEAGSELGYM